MPQFFHLTEQGRNCSSWGAAAAWSISPAPGQQDGGVFSVSDPPQSPSDKPKIQDPVLKKPAWLWASRLGHRPPASPPLGLREAALGHQRRLFLPIFAGWAGEPGDLWGIRAGTFVNRQPCYVDLINMRSANSKQTPALPQAEFLRTLPSKTLCHSCGEAQQTGEKLGSRQGNNAVEAVGKWLKPCSTAWWSLSLRRISQMICSQLPGSDWYFPA